MGLVDAMRAAPRDPAGLAAFVAGLVIDDAEIDALLAADPARPYGRRVLVNDGGLELMLATWTAGATCAPHDHGGATGVVRILRGRAIHRVYRPAGDALVEVAVETRLAGDLLPAGATLVHAMQDAGEEPLVTLHAYLPGIGAMVVYDVERARTLVVEAGCGAWVPEPERVLRAVNGFVAPDEI